jgi:hypothetical protein
MRSPSTTVWRALSRRLALALALASALGACGDDDGGDDRSTSASTTSAPPASAAPPTAGDDCAFDGGTATVSSAAESDFALLTEVRAARQPCFDRVVLEFRDPGNPGYQVGYQPGPIVQDGSGEPVAVEGAAYLVIRVAPASGFDSGTGTPTYDGPGRVAPAGTAHVREVVRTGDFEGVLTWVVGLDEQRPFTVDTLGGPTRLVVDIG